MSDIQVLMQIPCTTLTREEVGALLGYKESSLAGREFPPSIEGSNNRYHSFVVHQWLIERSQNMNPKIKSEWSKHKQNALALQKKKK